jgi:hypothetical protein
MTTTTRDELLDLIRSLPKRTTYEQAIDRLALTAELKHRLEGLRKGTVKTIPHAEVVKRFERKWRK